MLTVAEVTGGRGNKICQNLADVICERSQTLWIIFYYMIMIAHKIYLATFSFKLDEINI